MVNITKSGNIITIDSTTTSNVVILEKDDNIAWVKKYYIDIDSDSCTTKDIADANLREFTDMLTAGFRTMAEMGVTCHRQYISIDDLRDDTIDDWKIIDQDDDSDIILIECSVSDAPTLILEGLFGKINQ